jgi:hypothetical protein
MITFNFELDDELILKSLVGSKEARVKKSKKRTLNTNEYGAK